MKFTILLFACCISLSASAQTDNITPLANKIAQKMQDSLGLSVQQKDNIREINLTLANQKKLAWQQYKGSDSLGIILQNIENRRDVLYSGVISAEKYLLYKQKKGTLISNN